MPFQHHPHPMYPQQYPQSNPIPPIIPQIQQPLPLPNAPNPPRPTQFPAQPIANPNNRVGQPSYNTGAQNLPTYVITTVQIQQVQLMSGIFFPQKSSIVIEEENEEEEEQHQSQENPQ
ncbi:unnamed protein product [Adineta steineri]|uniref:Uncharacterized protein n=1 Tax=Adineta steineri TaxID=433720 RepID=A0A819Y345_9BILA|nr:unnamed protein product [Adineta steineri]